MLSMQDRIVCKRLGEIADELMERMKISPITLEVPDKLMLLGLATDVIRIGEFIDPEEAPNLDDDGDGPLTTEEIASLSTVAGIKEFLRKTSSK